MARVTTFDDVVPPTNHVTPVSCAGYAAIRVMQAGAEECGQLVDGTTVRESVIFYRHALVHSGTFGRSRVVPRLSRVCDEIFAQ
jgi:hypothetical protein